MDALLLKKKLLLFCGTGGVGKTTLSAATAIKAACLGLRVGLVTIDPARRLASSLGLNSLGSSAQNLDAAITAALGKKQKGSLSALMLDSQDTLKNFLLSIGGPETLKEFEANNLYQVISGNFSGTHDYLAMEKLFEMHESGNYDLIVLDTPPARHTLDFLDAPERIASFFDDRIFAWFLTDPRSNAITERLRAVGAKAALGILEKITGEGVINDFVRLAPHIYKVKNAFVERQSSIQKLLRSPAAGAFFVSSPTDLARGEAEPFLADAKKQEIQILGFLVNRCLMELCPLGSDEAAQKTAKASESVLAAYLEMRRLVDDELANVSRVRRLAHKTPVVLLPELDEDIHDIRGLYELAKRIEI